MRKISILVLTALTFIFVSCGNFLSDLKDEDVRMHNVVSNLVFDSVEYRLTADTNAKDGTVVTAVCNGAAVQGVAANGKIEYLLDTVFHDGDFGGRSYDIRFSAEGFSDKTDSFQYWPTVDWEMSLGLDRQPVFVGGADQFELPEVKFNNYDKNSVAVDTTFRVYENYDDNDPETGTKHELEVNADDWTVQDLKDFFSDSANADKTVEARYNIRPKCANGDELERESLVVYDCKNDVLVKNAMIKYEYGEYRPYLYDGTKKDGEYVNKVENMAGGNIAYQWQSSEDGNTWTDIAGATGKTYRITEADIGKEIRLQIIQTMGNEVKPAVESDTDLMNNHICDYALYYDGLLKVGELFDKSKIRGRLTDSFGRVYDAVNCTWENVEPEYFYTANDVEGSKLFSFIVTCAEGCSDDAEVFATVRYADLQEIPELSTEIDKISYGKVEFVESNSDLEYSTDNGATYKEITVDEIKIGSNRIIYIRKKSFGRPCFAGYIKESEPVQFEIPDEYIGVKTLTPGEGMITDIMVPKMTLEKSLNGNTVTVTPRLSNTESWFTYEYVWRIDGTLLSDCEWYNNGLSTSSTDNALNIDRTKLPKDDTYMIFCMVKISGEAIEGELMTLSDQISVTIQ
ncbi:MAG: hypothetical protein J6Y69_06900 [Treponema sp.]|nr:hypothetical protein [Treponema sp.]